MSISAPRTAALSHLPVHFVLKLQVQSNHKSFDEYISAAAKFWCDTFTHRMPSETRKHTPEAKSISPLGVNNYCSDRPAQPSYHTIIPAVPYLVWRLNGGAMCTYSEVRLASLCLLSHRVTTGEMMTCTPCLAESSNKHSLTPAPRKICNINHLISRSAGICMLGLIWWMNHFLSSVPQNTSCPKVGLRRTSNTDRDVKRGENINTVLSWIYETLPQGETCRGKEKVIYVGCLQIEIIAIDARLQTLF